jgi:hypothetical protein
MVAMIRRVRSAARVVDARPLTWIALISGGVVVWVATPALAAALHLSGSWIPVAVSATAGWFTLVVLAATVWEVVEILRDGPDILFAKGERHNWPLPWIPPALLLVGIVLGWLFFT